MSDGEIKGRTKRGIVVFLTEGSEVTIRIDDAITTDLSTWQRSFAYTAIPVESADYEPSHISQKDLETIGFAIVARLAAMHRLE